MSELTEGQIRYRRSKGVSKAWIREKELVAQGRGTRQWTLKEQRQILTTGRARGYQGHHMKSVSKYPEHADNPKNIQFLSARKGRNEHLAAHKGDYRLASEGRYNVNTGKIRQMGEGPPRAMKSAQLDQKVIETRAYKRFSTLPREEKTPAQQYAQKTSAPQDKALRSPAQGYAAGESAPRQYSRRFVKPSQSRNQQNTAQASSPARTSGQGKGSGGGGRGQGSGGGGGGGQGR